MKKQLLISLVLTVTILSPLSVFAETAVNKTGTTKKAVESEVAEKLASRSALLKEKLEVKKLAVCETKQDIIKNRSQGLAARAQTQLTNFTAIAGRVDSYYLNTVVPKGLTLSNYAALKADIAAKEAIVKSAIATAKADAQNFDCKGDDPKGQLGNFKVGVKNAIIALKDYRTSIKNFIVAIRTLVASSKTASGSAGSGE